MLDKEGVDWQLFLDQAEHRLNAVPGALKSAADRMRTSSDEASYRQDPVATLGTWRNFWASRIPYLQNAGLPEPLLANFIIDLLDQAGARHPDHKLADVTRLQELLRFGRREGPPSNDDDPST